MPPGTPYNGRLCPPFPLVRVDVFTELPDAAVRVHLLSHTHSGKPSQLVRNAVRLTPNLDHIVGLQAQSFASVVYCSEDAKEMLLRHEVGKERGLYDDELRAERNRTYGHLRKGPLLVDGTLDYTGSRDLLRPLKLNTATEIEIQEGEKVKISLFDANHCPGAVMFLIEEIDNQNPGTPRRAVLHTGDFRAEPRFLESIKQNEFLRPYLYEYHGPRRVLDVIYLDTACVMQTKEVPTKADAVAGLIDLMKDYPREIFFYINSWTWGYEDILKAIAQEFNTKIHFDRYKHGVYSHISDSLLREIGTANPSETRFHACERFKRCEFVDVDQTDRDVNNTQREKRWNSISKTGHRVVYVNPVNMSISQWKEYYAETRKRLLKGEEVNYLLVPLERHSPLPELQAFVSLFRPLSIIPNTLSPELENLDFYAIQNAFASCLADETRSKTRSGQPLISILPKSLLRQLHARLVEFESSHREGRQTLGDTKLDVAMKNLVGNEASEVAKRWLDLGGGASFGGMIDTLRNWLDFDGILDEKPHESVEELEQLPNPISEDSQAGAEERERTMHALFAPSDVTFHRSRTPSDTSHQGWGLPTPGTSPVRQSKTFKGLHILPLAMSPPSARIIAVRTGRETDPPSSPLDARAAKKPSDPEPIKQAPSIDEVIDRTLQEQEMLPSPQRQSETAPANALSTPTKRRRGLKKTPKKQGNSDSSQIATSSSSQPSDIAPRRFVKCAELSEIQLLEQRLRMAEAFASASPHRVHQSYQDRRAQVMQHLKRLKANAKAKQAVKHPSATNSSDLARTLRHSQHQARSPRKFYR